MKKITLALLALAVAMFAAVPATFASSITFEISFDGGGSYAPIACVAGPNSCTFTGYTNGDLSITVGSGFANFPGTATDANTSTSSLNIANTGTGSLSFLIRETADGYTLPNTNPLTLTVQESNTTPTGTFSFQTTGYLLNGGLPVCSAATGTVSAAPPNGDSASGPVTCVNGSPSFGLQTVTAYTLEANSAINTNTTVRLSAVPEPTSMMLFGSGLLGFAGMIRRKLNK